MFRVKSIAVFVLHMENKLIVIGGFGHSQKVLDLNATLDLYYDNH